MASHASAVVSFRKVDMSFPGYSLITASTGRSLGGVQNDGGNRNAKVEIFNWRMKAGVRLCWNMTRLGVWLSHRIDFSFCLCWWLSNRIDSRR